MAPPDLPKKAPSEHAERSDANAIEKSAINSQDGLLEGHEWKLARHVLFPSILVLMCPPSLLWVSLTNLPFEYIQLQVIFAEYFKHSR